MAVEIVPNLRFFEASLVERHAGASAKTGVPYSALQKGR